MGPKACRGTKPEKNKHFEDNSQTLKKNATIKNTIQKLFPHGKHYYNKEIG